MTKTNETDNRRSAGPASFHDQGGVNKVCSSSFEFPNGYSRKKSPVLIAQAISERLVGQQKSALHVTGLLKKAP